MSWDIPGRAPRTPVTPRDPASHEALWLYNTLQRYIKPKKKETYENQSTHKHCFLVVDDNRNNLAHP